MDDTNQQTISTDDVGEVGNAVNAEVRANDQGAIAAEYEDETVLEYIKRVNESVQKTKAWGKVKADSVEERIAKVGGEPSAELKAALADLRRTIGE